MKLVWVVVLCVAACDPAGPKKPETKNEITDSQNAEFFAAVARKDVAAIRKFISGPFEYGGMWFPSPACQSEFPVARHIAQDKIADFAACLATLPLVQSKHTDSLYGVAVGTYDPGIEIEIGFSYVDGADEAALSRIGFAGRQSRNDGIPAITSEALLSHITTGDPNIPTTPVIDEVLKAEMTTLHQPVLLSWFKICVDADGNVTRVRVRDTDSPLMATTYKSVIETWKFQPFKLGNLAVPVCAQKPFLYPLGSHFEGPEPLPLPDFTGTNEALLTVNLKALHRISGTTQIAPDDADKTRLSRSKLDQVEVATEYCIDEQGSVFQSILVEPSGLPNYDAKVLATVKTWKFEPLKLAGVPTRACTGLAIRYSQRR